MLLSFIAGRVWSSRNRLVWSRYESVNMSKIVDNPSIRKILTGIETVEQLFTFCESLPFANKIIPDLKSKKLQHEQFKKECAKMFVPDEFNEMFSNIGWIAYDSMNIDAMSRAIEIGKYTSLDVAERFLAEYYNADILKWGILRFQGHPVFRSRLRLVELARKDYFAGRYHACIPLLLALTDGLVNDVSNQVGFFSEGVDLTAWDCIAAHETGLQALKAVMFKGRNKTNIDSITIPYRNGILHGRELSYDNSIVAAKCWGALFAVRDWAMALANGNKRLEEEKTSTWRDVFEEYKKLKELKKRVESWVPRSALQIGYLPCAGAFESLPADTPERIVAEFVGDWCKGRYGPMAKRILHFMEEGEGKRAGQAREFFGGAIPREFVVQSAKDETSSLTTVEVLLEFDGSFGNVKIVSPVRVVYQGADGLPTARGGADGSWKIVQSSFVEAVRHPDLYMY